MFRYVSKRVLQLVLVFFIVSVLIFTVVRMTPLDPIASISKGKAMSEETRLALMREYGLDKSWAGQYVSWITGLFRGNLGKSFQYRQAVTELLAVRYRTSVQLVAMSALMIIFLAIPLGVVSAAHKNSLLDQTLTVSSLIFVSSPPFFTGILLMLLFTMVWPVFPTFGTGANFWDNMKYLFLPAVSLAAVRVALSMRITRSNMVEQLQAPYIQTATAKGLSRRTIVYKHALKNAAIPIMTVTALDISGMLGGSVLVEKVFSLNGVGTLLADSITKSDYPVTQSITLIMVLVFMLCNLFVDIMYGVIDPRVRLD